MENRFNENEEEYSSKQGCNIPVWKSPKYFESKKKAIEMIDSGKYGLDDGDFWILKNETKTKKMAYTGLIISHNGCLKINDNLEFKFRFRPECLTKNEKGFNDSLIYEYNCAEQGLYEVGEVSATNCKNDYPYAMAFKRCFDRVVLKNSKLAYAGVYSDSEADEFKEKIEEPKTKKISKGQLEQLVAMGTDLEKLAKFYGKSTYFDLTDFEADQAIMSKMKTTGEVPEVEI